MQSQEYGVLNSPNVISEEKRIPFAQHHFCELKQRPQSKAQ